MHRKSSSSAGAVYPDREHRIEELRAGARRAAARLPGLERVILFGSLVAGIPTPRSDADLLVIVAESEHRRLDVLHTATVERHDVDFQIPGKPRLEVLETLVTQAAIATLTSG